MQKRKQSKNSNYGILNFVTDTSSFMEDTSRPLHQELEELRTQVAYVHKLEEREKALTAELAHSHEAISSLRDYPKFLEPEGWKKLENVINLIYKGYTLRLKADFPLLTDLDIQLCMLLKLQLSNYQIAAIIAVSPSSVSMQKSRLKKRLLQVDEHLFDQNNLTLDAYLLNY